MSFTFLKLLTFTYTRITKLNVHIMYVLTYLFLYLVNSEDGGIDKNIKEVD